jgi:hypothetical protein
VQTHGSLFLFFLLWIDGVYKSRLPAFPDEQDEVRENEQQNDSDHNNIETEKANTLRIRSAHFASANNSRKVFSDIRASLPLVAGRAPADQREKYTE